MKKVTKSDLTIGRLYSDTPTDGPFTTILRYEGLIHDALAFKYISGHNSYIIVDDELIKFLADDHFWEILSANLVQ